MVRCVLAGAFSALATIASEREPSPAPRPVDRPGLAAQVRAELIHAWEGYKRHAWGHDELKPLSRAPHDWHAAPLYMTAVDALDTLMLMGLDAEAERRASREVRGSAA